MWFTDMQKIKHSTPYPKKKKKKRRIDLEQQKKNHMSWNCDTSVNFTVIGLIDQSDRRLVKAEFMTDILHK